MCSRGPSAPPADTLTSYSSAADCGVLILVTQT